ncbi:MAG: hypothetical protein JST80_13600 [Bdellovibrionales bacterium]|nr:hypothetical protein [Bdellovibrionales bacterium]
MTEQNKSDPGNPSSTPAGQAPVQDQKAGRDSLGIPMKKSPIMIYALLQIPILIIMVVILYFMYQARQN